MLSYFRHAVELNHLVELEHWSLLFNISSTITYEGYLPQGKRTAILFLALYGLTLRVMAVPIFVLRFRCRDGG